MKCNQFEDTIYELARNQIIDESIREKVIAHTGECAECESRLDEQRSITNGLRAMVESYKEIVPPARVEAALVESFRRLNQYGISKDSKTSGSIEKTARHSILRYAAAAAILLILGLVVWQLEGVFSRERKEQAVDRKKIDQPVPTQKEEPKIDPEPRKGEPAVAGSIQRKKNNKSRGYNIAIDKTKGQEQNGRATTAKSEIATEFIPLVDFEDISAMDRGRLLRVELPRSTLLTFGLPVNAARANEPLIADVLIGDDGLARAIRFVR